MQSFPLTVPNKAFLSVNGVELSGPISREEFDRIWATATDSTHGVPGSNERVMDASQRNSRETQHVMFDCDFLQDLQTEVKGLTALLCGRHSFSALKFHKCLLYQSDGSFEEHRDRRRHEHHTHTVTLTLSVAEPQLYTFRCDGQDHMLSDKQRMDIFLFPRDALHALHMHSGYRICLVFHLLTQLGPSRYEPTSLTQLED